MAVLKSEIEMGLYLNRDVVSARTDAAERRKTHIHAAYV